MELLVTLESILFNNLLLEEIWAQFGNDYNIINLLYNIIKYFTNTYKVTGNLKSLPYSSHFMNIYTENLQQYTITLAINIKYKAYQNLIQSNIKNLKQFTKIIFYDNDQELKNYILNDCFVHSFKLTNTYNGKFMIVNNILEYIYLLFGTNVQEYRMSLWNGSLWILWSLFSYYIPIFFMWPLLFNLNSHFNTNIIFISCGILILQIAFMRLTRNLQEIDYERSIVQINKVEPLCSSEYIFNGASIFMATLIWLILYIFVIYFMFKYFFISITIFIISATYYIFMLSPFLMKIITTCIAIIIGHSLLQYKWLLSWIF